MRKLIKLKSGKVAEINLFGGGTGGGGRIFISDSADDDIEKEIDITGMKREKINKLTKELKPNNI